MVAADQPGNAQVLFRPARRRLQPFSKTASPLAGGVCRGAADSVRQAGHGQQLLRADSIVFTGIASPERAILCTAPGSNEAHARYGGDPDTTTVSASEAFQHRPAQRLALGQSVSPALPQRVAPDHSFAVAGGCVSPARRRPAPSNGLFLRVLKARLERAVAQRTSRSCTSPSRSCSRFQVLAPLLVLLRKKIFDQVAKALDADAELVPGSSGCGCAEPAECRLPGLLPFFQRHYLEQLLMAREAGGNAPPEWPPSASIA